MGRAMDRFQLVLGDNNVGLVRESWEAAAQDAVSAGLAAWVWDQFPNTRAIQWTAAGQATIKALGPRADEKPHPSEADFHWASNCGY